MKAAKVVIFFTITVLACDRSGGGRGVASSDAMRSEVTPSAPSGGAVTTSSSDVRPRVVVVSPGRGASNVDTRLRIGISVSCPGGNTCASDARTALAVIASKVKLSRSPDDTVSVNPEVVSPPAISAKGGKSDVVANGEINTALVPATSLAGDAPYLLEIRSDSDIVFAFADASVEDNRRSLASTNAMPTMFHIPVFTGSAPTVTRLDVSSAPGKSLASIRVQFSEPVRLGALVKGFQVRAANGDVQAACPRSGVTQKCADMQRAEVSELVDFVLSKAVEFSIVQTATIELSGSVDGSGRTVAEGARIRGKALVAVGGESALVAGLGSSWTSCSANGDIQCVRYLDL